MKKTYNAAIIGCGNIAGGYDERSGFKHVFTHAGAYKRHRRFRLKAIAETDKKRLSQFSKIWGVERAYSDYKALLKDEDIDIVSVCVPDNLHSLLIRDVIKYGSIKCILCEKPITATFKEARDIVRMCEKNRVSLYVNYNRLWDPLHRAVKDLIAKDFLGYIQGGVGYYVRGIRHNGTTMVNTLRFLFGSDVAGVQALRMAGCGIVGDLAVDGVLSFDNGAQVLIVAADKKGYGHSIFEIDIMGNKARIRIVDNGYKVELYKTAEYKRYRGVWELIPSPEAVRDRIPESEMDRTLVATFDEIAVSLDRKRVDLNYAKDASRDLFIAQALMESARSKGKLIKV